MPRESDMDEAKGRVKEAAGTLSGNNELEREGKEDRAAASVKDKVEDVKDSVTDAIDSMRGKDKS